MDDHAPLSAEEQHRAVCLARVQAFVAEHLRATLPTPADGERRAYSFRRAADIALLETYMAEIERLSAEVQALGQALAHERETVNGLRQELAAVRKKNEITARDFSLIHGQTPLWIGGGT